MIPRFLLFGIPFAMLSLACGGGDGGSTTPSDAGAKDAPADHPNPFGNPFVDAASACPAGRLLCGTACVDPKADLANCGACGVTCAVSAPSTVACALGRCLATLAVVPGLLGHVVVDSANAYAFNSANTSATKVPVGGGAPATILEGNAKGKLLAVDIASLYWFDDGDRRIHSSQTDGTGPGALSTPVGSNLGPVGTKVDGTGVYFATGSAVYRLQLRGGDAEPLTITTASIEGFDLDADAFYFSDDQGNVIRAPRDGSNPVKVAFGQSSVNEVVVSATDVYWSGGSGLFKVPLMGGMYTPLGTSGTNLVIDSGNLYASTSAGLGKMPLTGKAFVSLTASKAARPDAIDGTAVYWTENANGVGRIFKLWPK